MPHDVALIATIAIGRLFCGNDLARIRPQPQGGDQLAANSLPLQDAFAVLFFVSVGMLFDPSIILREPHMVAAGRTG